MLTDNQPNNLQKGRGSQQGATHFRAKQSDHEIEMIQHMHVAEGWGYRRIAKTFNTARSTIQFICTYRRR